MAQIQVNHLTFYYEGNYEELFSDVSFAIDTDWKLGFVGRNGRGKTTFLNLLMGKYEYRGSISAPVHFEYFPFQVKDKSRMTIDIVEEMDPGYELWKLLREINLMEMEPELLHRRDPLRRGMVPRHAVSLHVVRSDRRAVREHHSGRPRTHLGAARASAAPVRFCRA